MINTYGGAIRPYPEAVRELIDGLREVYTDAEVLQWLTSPHPRLEGAIALDEIIEGRLDRVELVVDALLESAYV